MLPYMTVRRLLLRFVGMLGNRPVDDAAIHYIEKAVVEELGQIKAHKGKESCHRFDLNF